MRMNASAWPATAALALCLGFFTYSGYSPALAADEEDQPDAPKKKVIRVYTTDDEEDAGVAAKGGYLGVQVQDLTRRLKRAMDLEGVDGALVNRVEEDSPAERAGIKKGDVIVQLGRATTPDATELTRTVRKMKPDEKTSVIVVRDGERRTLTVVLGTRPKAGEFEFNLPDDGDFQWEGGPPPSAGRIFLRNREDMKQELDLLRDEIAKLREEIHELRLELQRRPARAR